MECKFLPESRIEGEAERLLAAYGERFGAITKPPVPVDEIVDSHLDLRLEVDDLRGRFKTPDVLGAIWVEERRVAVDTSLDPSHHPHLEGRYRFTLAHETGHWMLHRAQLIASRQPRLFTGQAPPSVACRDSHKPRIELQADYFAGCLLMPVDLVRSLWVEQTGSDKPYVAADDLRAVRGKTARDLPTIDVARRMANDFKVSGQAMQIRLLKLELIVLTEPPPSLF